MSNLCWYGGWCIKKCVPLGIYCAEHKLEQRQMAAIVGTAKGGDDE